MGIDTDAERRHQPRGAVTRRGLVLIHFVASTGSTNADLLADAAAGRGGEGSWLIARRQTAGRGRQGRHWDSAEGNFHGSTVVHLALVDPPAPSLSLVAGVALHDALCASAPDIAELQLKWPNDVMVGSAKLGGILLERSGDAVICGLGVNLGWAPDVAGRATVSLANLGFAVVVDDFAVTLASHFEAALGDWRMQPLAALHSAWLSRAHPIGTILSRMTATGNTLTGTFDGLEDDGSLRLRCHDGALLVISSGEVMLG